MTAAADGAAPSSIKFRHVLAVFVGNGLEFYDFLIFSYFAVYISRTFYPSGDPGAALLATLATFGAGFLTRPIGAIVIGSMGDRIGRKPAMLVSFMLMGIAIIGLALTPSYATIGVAAPVLALVFRLLQGFALGGEVGPTTAFMAEAAPPHRRGLYLSMQYGTQDVAILFAGVIATSLAAMLTDQQLQDWGWRAAMLVGAAIVPFGLWLRRALPETLHAADDATLAPDGTTGALTLRQKLAPHSLLIVLGLLLLGASTIGKYTVNYLTTYALTTLALSATVAFGMTLVGGLTFLIFEVLGGYLTDRVGRKPVMVIPGALLIFAIVPCFRLIGQADSLWVLYGAEVIMVMLLALAYVPVLVTLTESLPKSVRSGTVATVYAFAIATFGGSTQFIIQWLIELTDNPLMPAYYLTGAATVGLVAMALIKESAPLKQTPRDRIASGSQR